MIRLRLDQLLKEKQKTLYRLREETGLTMPTLVRYKHNRVRKVDLDVLEKIRAALGCQVAEMFEMEDGREAPS